MAPYVLPSTTMNEKIQIQMHRIVASQIDKIGVDSAALDERETVPEPAAKSGQGSGYLFLQVFQ